MLERVMRKPRAVSRILRSENPIKSLRAALNSRPRLAEPTIPHRLVEVDSYPCGETTRSVRAAYERAYGHDHRKPGVYASADWSRLSFALDHTVKGGSVLDVGSNRGQFPNMLAEAGHFPRVVSIDLMLNRKFLPLHGDTVEYFKMSVAKQRFADNSFDVVTCFEVLEHLEPEVFDAGLRELRRVCKSQLLMSVPYAERLPLYRGHRRRFVDADFTELFPNAKLTLLRGRRSQWMFIEEDLETST